IVGGDRLLEPADVRFRASLREAERLLDGECAIGVDEKLAIADRHFGLPHPIRIAFRLAADLHLDEAAAVAVHPTGKLLAQLLVRIAGETATAIDRNTVA